MQDVWSELKQPWQDQVKGSWWKAPLVIIGYFILRIMTETWVLIEGARNSNAQITPENLETINLTELMTFAPIQYFLQTLVLTLLIILVCRFLGFRFFDFKTFTWRTFLKALGFYFLIYVLQIIVTMVILAIVPDYSQPANQTAVESMVKNMNVVLMFINIVILTPITEEYILRGLIMKYTFSLMPTVGAIVAAVVFTLLHSPANWMDFMVYFILSAGFTFIYWYTRKLEYPILLHIIQNFIGFMVIQLL